MYQGVLSLDSEHETGLTSDVSSSSYTGQTVVGNALNKPDSIPELVEKDTVNLFRELAALPELKRAVLVPAAAVGSVTVQSDWSQRDLNRGKKQSFARRAVLDEQTYCVLSDTGPMPASDWVLKSYSRDGRKWAQVVEYKNKAGDDCQLLEVWDNSGCRKSIDVTGKDEHGKIYGEDSQFASFQWGPDNKSVLYIAEKKLPKSRSFFKPAGPSEDKPDSAPPGLEHEWKDEWGELLVGKHEPVVCVLNTETQDITVLDSQTEDVSAGQAVWTPEGAVLYVGWYSQPFRLCAIYCSMRRNALFLVDLGGKTERVTDDQQSVRSPRFSPDGARVVYLRNAAAGAHRQCCQLCEMDWATREFRVVIDYVHTPRDDGFPGLYLETLPRSCWLADSRHLLCSSELYSQLGALVVDLKTGNIKRLGQAMTGSFAVHDVQKDKVLLAYSTPVSPVQLRLCALESGGDVLKASWHDVPGQTPELPSVLQGLNFRVLKHTSVDTQNVKDKSPFESIVIWRESTDTTKRPLILYPHGGPHVSYSTSYIFLFAGLASTGFAVQLVNYRGSTGYGQRSIDTLTGAAGEVDVSDCRVALRDVTEGAVCGDLKLDTEKLLMCGGSHGGFLSAHMVAQYPDLFKAACCRNPVTNLAGMFGVTDIPDWLYVESGLPYDFKTPLDASVYEKLISCSPMSLTHKINAPVMVMIGGADRRVPPSQGRMFHKQLRALGTETRLLEYPEDSHPLKSVMTEADCFVNIIRWFLSHL